MKIERKKVKIIVSWLLVLLWAGVIFYLSSRTAAESTVQSQGMISTFSGFWGKYIDDEETMTKIDGIVRESAHAVEYMVLSMLLFNALSLCINYRKDEVNHIVEQAETKNINISLTTSGKWKSCNLSIYTIVICMLYALSDEIHQIPIEGRAFEILDLAIDFTGICLGVIVLLVLGYLKNRHKRV